MWKGVGCAEECGLCAIEWAVWYSVGYIEQNRLCRKD